MKAFQLYFSFKNKEKTLHFFYEKIKNLCYMSSVPLGNLSHRNMLALLLFTTTNSTLLKKFRLVIKATGRLLDLGDKHNSLI